MNFSNEENEMFFTLTNFIEKFENIKIIKNPKDVSRETLLYPFELYVYDN